MEPTKAMSQYRREDPPFLGKTHQPLGGTNISDFPRHRCQRNFRIKSPVFDQLPEIIHHNWLVVGQTPLKNMSSSVGMMKFPAYGQIIHMFQTTNPIGWMRFKHVENHKLQHQCWSTNLRAQEPFCRRAGNVEQRRTRLKDIYRSPLKLILKTMLNIRSTLLKTSHSVVIIIHKSWEVI